MKDSKKCGCACKKGDSNEPKDIKTQTQVTPEDFDRIKENPKGEGVSEQAVDEATVITNPDPESMNSRG